MYPKIIGESRKPGATAAVAAVGAIFFFVWTTVDIVARAAIPGLKLFSTLASVLLLVVPAFILIMLAIWMVRNEETLRSLVDRTRMSAPFLVLLAVFLLSPLFLGGRAAQSSWFMVPEGSAKTIVLRIYGDTAILTRFEKKTKHIDGSIKAVKLTDIKGYLQYRKVGRLRRP